MPALICVSALGSGLDPTHLNHRLWLLQVVPPAAAHKHRPPTQRRPRVPRHRQHAAAAAAARRLLRMPAAAVCVLGAGQPRLQLGPGGGVALQVQAVRIRQQPARLRQRAAAKHHKPAAVRQQRRGRLAARRGPGALRGAWVAEARGGWSGSRGRRAQRHSQEAGCLLAATTDNSAGLPQAAPLRPKSALHMAAPTLRASSNHVTTSAARNHPAVIQRHSPPTCVATTVHRRLRGSSRWRR
jgi:hypothetical protein